jgi:hypothetical protein
MDNNEKELVFNYADAPKHWFNCFHAACTKAGECMHFLTGRNLPDGMTFGNAIYPTAYQNGTCEHFKQVRVIRGAYGFNGMLHEMTRRDEVQLRSLIKAYLGGNGTYYMYNNGVKLLTPEQQEWILRLIRQHGYTGEKEFDGYRYQYDFSE